MRAPAGACVAVLVSAIVAGCGGAAPSKAAATTPLTTAPPVAATAAGVRPLADGALVAGTYSFLGGAGTIEMPAGWEACCSTFAVLKGDDVAMIFEDITNVVVYGDSCKWKAGPNAEPKGAQAAAAAFSAQRGHQASAAEATTVAGRPGWRVRLMVPADQAVTLAGDNNVFTGCDDGQFATWGLKGSTEPGRYQQGPSQIDTLHVVDVGDRTYVLDVVTSPKISGGDQAELDAMLASVKFK